MAVETVLKIGTSQGCDISLGDTQEPERILATIGLDWKGLVVLRPASQEVVCKVNGNRIASEYWLKTDDEVIIDGLRLDWRQVEEKLLGLDYIEVLPTEDEGTHFITLSDGGHSDILDLDDGIPLDISDCCLYGPPSYFGLEDPEEEDDGPLLADDFIVDTDKRVSDGSSSEPQEESEPLLYGPPPTKR